MPARVIWQYWENVGDEPAFVDDLRAIAKKNAGVEVVLVTPQTLDRYISNIPRELFAISQVAHKADMIRAMLVQRHGGMWLDSDAIVLRQLDWILDLLDTYEFVGFNDGGALAEGRPWVRVNCFASRPGGQVFPNGSASNTLNSRARNMVGRKSARHCCIQFAYTIRLW